MCNISINVFFIAFESSKRSFLIIDSNNRSMFNILKFKTEANNISFEFNTDNKIPELEKAAFQVLLQNLEIKIPNEVYDVIKIWQTSSGQYTNFKENIGHQLINSGLDNYVHKPRVGDIAVFPSNYIYEHASLPMESGTKYCVVIMTDINELSH